MTTSWKIIVVLKIWTVFCLLYPNLYCVWVEFWTPNKTSPIHRSTIQITNGEQVCKRDHLLLTSSNRPRSYKHIILQAQRIISLKIFIQTIPCPKKIYKLGWTQILLSWIVWWMELWSHLNMQISNSDLNFFG